MPLNTKLRSGMMMRDMLLFSSGNKTFVYDPVARSYYGEVDAKKKLDGLLDCKKDEDEGDMPEMKNAELYTMSDGTVYLIGGKK